MQSDIKHQSAFSRDMRNAAKMGAYYTDIGHCRSIASFLEFPEEEEVCALEPSIGDGEAILATVGGRANVRIFGVELNDSVAERTGANPAFEKIYRGDFLEDFMISHNSFSYCFGNPPYISELDGEREEKKFLEKVTPLMKKGGILVWVIGYGTFSERSYLRYFYNRYEFLWVYRFREPEYSKYRQVAVIARRRSCNQNILKEALDRLETSYAEDRIPVLPESYDGRRAQVPASDVDGLQTFAYSSFPADEALEYLISDAGGQLDDMEKAIGKKLTVPEYDGIIEGHPPIPLSKDSAYLVSVCGASSGRCGDEDLGTMHLKRGVVRMKDESVFVPKEINGEEKMVEVVTTSSKIVFTVCQQNGEIRQLL